jgi:hypothetical protein
MSSIELVDMEAKAESEMAPVMARAQAFMVVDEQTYLAADAIIATIMGKVKALEPEISPMKETATKAWKAAVAFWKKYIDDPLEACKTLDRKRYGWKKTEDAKRAAEAERLRREEQKKAEEEKLALATRMEAAGMKEQAEKVLDAPIAPTTVATPVAVEKPKGQTIIENWQARVVDANLVPREFCIPDTVALGKLAKLMKGKASVPGVEFFDVGTVRRSG